MAAMVSPTGPEFKVSLQRQGVEQRILLSGELDVAVAESFQQQLDRAVETEGAVVLDLSDLTYIDSTGLRIIHVANQRAKRYGCDFTLIRASKQVHYPFEITGLDKALPFR